MPVHRLTKQFVENVPATSQVEFYYDSELKGFSLKVYPSGEKRWCVEYRPGAGGRRAIKRRMVLGSIATITAYQARDAARKVLAAVSLGEDPALARKGDRQMPPFREFATRFLEEEAALKLKPRTVVNYRIYLVKHAVPMLGALKLDKVGPSDVVRLHRRIGQTKPMTANRVLECISSLYRYAVTCGLVPKGFNPTTLVEAFREQRRERFLSTQELTRLGATIREAETTGIPWNIDETKPKSKHTPKKRLTIIDDHATAALRLLILTGARLREILHLEWSHVDLERGLLLLPDSKTGRKAILLNGPAITVLSALPQHGKYVIAGETPNACRHDLNRPWRAIRLRAGLGDVRLHDLRHTHASIGVGAGLGLPVIGKLLGHTQPSTTARYAHFGDDPLRNATELIGKRIAVAMGEEAA